MTIKWSRSSTRQLAAIHAYIASDNLEAADRVLAKTELAVEQLLLYPNSGREGRVKGTRELIILETPYILAYRIKSKQAIQILAILHGKRRWPDEF